LTLKYEKLLSSFAFNFNMRSSNEEVAAEINTAARIIR
jgi:hypothetical protein